MLRDVASGKVAAHTARGCPSLNGKGTADCCRRCRAKPIILFCMYYTTTGRQLPAIGTRRGSGTPFSYEVNGVCLFSRCTSINTTSTRVLLSYYFYTTGAAAAACRAGFQLKRESKQCFSMFGSCASDIIRCTVETTSRGIAAVLICTDSGMTKLSYRPRELNSSCSIPDSSRQQGRRDHYLL